MPRVNRLARPGPCGQEPGPAAWARARPGAAQEPARQPGVMPGQTTCAHVRCYMRSLHWPVMSDHGSPGRYKGSQDIPPCRCDICKAGHAERLREYRAGIVKRKPKNRRARRSKSRPRQKCTVLQWDLPFNCTHYLITHKWRVTVSSGDKVPCPKCGRIDIVPSE